jgi:UDP-3-O-[3-hydroxymyristoyl] glucosamine N-acyltransferase
MRLKEIAEKLNGVLNGEDIEIEGVSDLDFQREKTIAFVENKKYLEFFENSPISALILPENIISTKKPYITVKDIKESLAKLLSLFNPYDVRKKPVGIEERYPFVAIEKDVEIDEGVTIYPFTTIMSGSKIGRNTVIYSNCFIGRNVEIGENCVIKSGVKIDDGTTIGNNVIVHHNTVIGGDGFGYYQKDGKNVKIPQIGRIRIGNDVEIGACVTIDRATIGDTVIEDGVKIDNLVQIAHNVKIGANSIIVAQVGIAGSSKIGRNCILAGQSGIADHVVLENNVVVLAQSGVQSREYVKSGSILFGTPAKPAMEEKRIQAALLRLPELVKKLANIEKKLSDGK